MCKAMSENIEIYDKTKATSENIEIYCQKSHVRSHEWKYWNLLNNKIQKMCEATSENIEIYQKQKP